MGLNDVCCWGFWLVIRIERYEWDKFGWGFLLECLVGVGLNKNKNEKVMLKCLVGDLVGG